ncbi:hypothetical protein SEUCBS139899_010831, partial [Sporothrix eucalyptigena]
MVRFLGSKNCALSPMLILTTALLAISAFNYGFSDQAFASCQAMYPFVKQFGRFEKKTQTYVIDPLFKSLYNSLKSGAQAVAEMAPAQIRGSMGVLYWLTIKVGGLVVTCITRRTSAIPSNASWQIPFGLILIIPAVVIAMVWFIPESPRWLLLHDRQEDAIESLSRLKNKNTPAEEIRLEFDELSQRVATQLKHGSFRHLFTSKNRMRTFVVVMVNFFQQASGQAFASQYGTLFVQALKTVNPFSVTVGTNATDIGALIICFLTVDVLGRRTLMLASSTLQVAALVTMGGLGTAGNYTNIKKGIVAMLILYSFAWSLGSGPLTYVIAAELPSSPLREATLQIAYTLKLATEFAVTFSYPYLETADDPGHINLGGRLGFIYGSLAVLAVAFYYIFIPETRQLTLEDIDDKFYSESNEKDIEIKVA